MQVGKTKRKGYVETYMVTMVGKNSATGTMALLR
ncbi:hypothetical protein SAMN05421766_10747 [Zobellia uliginosa]|uniref:Transposase n=1 Tax=Zobellia uliginosa TaxID=143224 RepID=A0ABY1L0I2_9FLAO|nr:hypothetical protein SAMN05421766_10747 [Zobellia uliginosa]